MNQAVISLLSIFSAFFLSGFSALIYETLWARAFGLALGNTTVAASAVLSAFMAGLALGSFLGGKYADRLDKQKLLKLFVFLEILSALFANLTLPFLNFTQPLMLKVGLAGGNPWLQSFIWFIFSFTALIIPTTLMGATLPALTRWSAPAHGENPDKFLSILYGINTAGAVAGALLTGFLLIPAIGVKLSFLFAACANLLAAFIAILLLSSKSAPEKKEAGGQVSQTAPDDAPPEKRRYIPAFILLITGASAMICEVAWIRAFSLVLGSSTYSFTLMLFTVLLGLSAGSLAFSLLRRVGKITMLGFALLLASTAVVTLFYLPTINFLPYIFVRLFRFTLQEIFFLHSLQLLLCFSYVFMPSFLMGMIFPWALKLSEPSGRSIGFDTGFYYSANTAGNIIGSAGAGLILLPLIGAERSILLAISLYAAAAVIAFVSYRGLNARLKTAAAAGFLIFIFAGISFRPKWDPYIMNCGAFIYAPEYQDADTFKKFIMLVRTNRLLYFKDGISSTVSAFQTPWEERFLRVNGKSDASTCGDVPAQLLTAYLPYMFHSGNPETAMVIGLGSGMTAGALSVARGLNSIDVIEIEPAVKNAVRLFNAFNHDLADNPKVNVIYADARHYLASSSKKYDVIASEPSNPWIAGVSYLFTKESFELARSRLNPGGVYCQWFHIYSMSESDFRMVMNTFAAAFPHVMLMSATSADLMMLGSNSPWSIDYEKINGIFFSNQLLRGDLALIGLNHPFTFLVNSFLLNDSEFRKYCLDAPLHLDDRPTLEFTAPNFLRFNAVGSIFSNLLTVKKSMMPENLNGFKPEKNDWEQLFNLSGEALLRSKYLDRAENAFNEAYKYNPKSARTLTNLARVYNLQDNHLRSEQELLKALKFDPNYSVAWFHLGMLYLGQNMEDKGLECLEKGLAISPFDPMGCIQVSRIYIERGKKGAAQKLLKRALTVPIANRDIRMSLTLMLNSLQSK